MRSYTLNVDAETMTGNQTLLARAALGLLAASVGLLLTSLNRPFAIPTSTFNRALLVLFAATRVGLFTLVFLILKVSPRGDVPAYYIHEAAQAGQHLVIYRDFWSNYAPLHPYLDASLLGLWHSPLVLILFAVLVEIATLPLWLIVGRAILPETVVRTAALLYLTSPISLQYVAIDGQNNVLISALLGASLYAILRRREILAGMLLGTSIAAVKFLPLVFVPAYLICAPRRMRFLTGLCVVLTIVYGSFLWLGAPVLIPLQNQGSLKTAGDLWYLLESVIGRSLTPGVLDLITAIAIACLCVYIAWVSLRFQEVFKAAPLVYGIVSITLTVLVFSKKSWPPYLIWALFPICLVIAIPNNYSRLRQFCFALFSLIAVTEHSIWSTNLGQISSIRLHHMLMRPAPLPITFFLIELALIACYSWLLFLSGEAISSQATHQPKS